VFPNPYQADAQLQLKQGATQRNRRPPWKENHVIVKVIIDNEDMITLRKPGKQSSPVEEETPPTVADKQGPHGPLNGGLWKKGSLTLSLLEKPVDGSSNLPRATKNNPQTILNRAKSRLDLPNMETEDSNN